MKIKLFPRSKCIEIAKELKLKEGITQENVDKMSTGELLHFAIDCIFSGKYFDVVHIQYDGDDNPNIDNLIGYNISLDKYGTSYFVQKEFVEAIYGNNINDIEVVDLLHKPVI